MNYLDLKEVIKACVYLTPPLLTGLAGFIQ